MEMIYECSKDNQKGQLLGRKWAAGLLQQKADTGFWEDVWSRDAGQEYYKPFLSGNLYTFERIFSRHLPRQGKILEAGCKLAVGAYVDSFGAKKSG